jgi:hypothetical protein
MAIIYGTDHAEVDYNDPVGQVRLLISDVSTDLSVRLFSDLQLQTFLGLTNGSVYRAAARALRVVAISEVLIGKVIKTQAGTSTDGAKVSAELRALAGEYDIQAGLDDAASEDASFFEITPLYASVFPEGVEQGLP